MTIKVKETLVVLKPPTATIDVVRVARKNDWHHMKRITPDERRLYEEIYEIPNTNTMIRVIDDHFVQIIYVSIQGKDRQQIESILREQIGTIEDKMIDTLLESRSPKDRASAIRILGAIAPDTANARTVNAFLKAVEDRSLEVFGALIAAVGRAAWPELWFIVDELTKSRKPEAEELRKGYESHVPRLK